MRITRTVALSCLLLTAGCSLNKFAIDKLGDALANPGTTYASDDDPELIEGAIPFSLKLIESLLESSPKHEGLLFAAASGFTQYSYAFVQQQADYIEDRDFDAATAMRVRARKLDLRARDYAMRGLDVRHRAFTERLRRDPKTAVAEAARADVPLLYWAGASWGAAIALSKEIPELVADLPIVEALMDRALALDESYNAGAIHNFMVSYEMARPGASPADAEARSRKHFDRVVSITEGRAASPYITLAEAVSLGKQDRAEFETLVNQALAVDPDARPEWRLENLIMQRRARWLMSRLPDLFLDAIPDTVSSPGRTFNR